jgi:hypothetical protein
VAQPEPATTTLYRVVTAAELDDIRRSGAFRNPFGIENKYFAVTAEGATAYAQQAYKAFGDGPFTMVETTILAHSITPDMRVTVDRSIETVIIPTQQLSELSSPQVLSYTLLPGR